MIRLSWNGAQKLQQINVYTVEGRSCNVQVSIATSSANLNIETLPKEVRIIAVNNGTATTYSRFAKN